MPPEYLGEGVYIEWLENEFILYTSDGIDRISQIYLEVEIMNKLISYARAATNRIP